MSANRRQHRRQQKKVRMTYHALDRLDSRSGRSPRKMRNKIARRLLAMLRAGVRPDENLGVKVPAEDGLVAICTPNWTGGWDIVTVRPDREDEAGAGKPGAIRDRGRDRDILAGQGEIEVINVVAVTGEDDVSCG